MSDNKQSNETYFLGFYTSPRFFISDLRMTQDLIDDVKNRDAYWELKELVKVVESDRYKLRVCRDGFVAVKFSTDTSIPALSSGDFYAKVWFKRLSYVNSLCLAFDIASYNTSGRMLMDKYFNEDDIIHFSPTEHNTDPAYIVRTPNYTHEQLKNRDKYFEDVHISNVIGHSVNMPESTLDLAIIIYDKMALSDDIIEVSSQIYKAISEHRTANFSNSLILSWFIIESYLNETWRKYIELSNATFADSSKRISSERFRGLTGSNFTISIIIDVLELNSLISFEDYKILERLRKKRNNVVHGLMNTKIEDQDCVIAIEFCIKILSQKLKLDLKGYSSIYSPMGP